MPKSSLPRGNLGSSDGSVYISATTRFQGAGAHFLFTTCRQEGCWTDDCCTTYHDRFRQDFAIGYRYLYLEDQLGITESLTTTQTPADDTANPSSVPGRTHF